MSSILLKGYNTQGGRIQNKEGRELDEQYLQRYLCVQCKFILRWPYQMICGDRICRGCFPSAPFNCPSCEDLIEPQQYGVRTAKEDLVNIIQNLSTLEILEFFRDKSCQNDIKSFIVVCKCGEWQGSLDEWESPQSLPVQHASDCPKRLTSCLHCGLSTPVDTLELHVQQCQSVEVVCDMGCGIQFPRSYQEQHAHECPKRPTRCSFCALSVPMDALQVHQQSCYEAVSVSNGSEVRKHTDNLHGQVKPFQMLCDHFTRQSDGSEEQANTGLNKQSHWYSENSTEKAVGHMELDSGAEIAELKEDMKQIRRVIEDTCSEQLQTGLQVAAGNEKVPPEAVRRIEQQLRKGVAEITEMKKTLAKSSRKVEFLERTVKHLMEEIRNEQLGLWSLADSGEDFSPSATKPLASEGVDLRPEVKRLSEKCGQLNEIVTTLVADMEQHKGTLAQMNISVDHLSQVVPRYKSVLEEMNLKIDILEVKSSNGIYVWKVNELGRRYREARTGKTISLYSPPFYTSNHGYRLCLRAYLYGDGSGKGTHISLFIVLMKSEYDDILSWPFRHRVTLSLINQDNPLSADAAIMHKFVPNPESSSFQKPKDTFNIAAGFPEFAELSVMNDSSFVKNDTIYFRVKLDPPETPTGPDNLKF